MEGVPITVLRGHDRLISSLCTVKDNFIFSADELGNVLAWKRIERSCIEELEYELLTEIHLESSSITTICSNDFSSEGDIHLLVQIKSGEILEYKFDGRELIKTAKRVPCGTFTFCRMSSLKLASLWVLAYPSPELENSINVLKIQDDSKNSYLHKNYLLQSSGMCLFSKLKLQDSIILLICGYESGKLAILDISNREYKVIFEDRVLEESCTDADLFEDTLVVVGASKNIKMLKDVFKEPKSLTIDIPFSGCNSICIRPDGKLFVTGGWDCKLRFFSLKTGKLLAVLDHHFEAVSDVKFIEIGGKYITTAASSDGTISLWTLYS